MRKCLQDWESGFSRAFKPIGFMAVFLLLSSEIFAQGFTVSGKVTDELGEGLPGATVLEKGTSNGTITDVYGNFSLNVTSVNSVLVASFVGYGNKEISVGNRTTINIDMLPGIASLDEVVVVGYGTQKKQDVITSITSIDAKQISKVPTPSFTQALQGTMSGVQMFSAGGEPGAAARILIRGTGSVTAATEPLYIIDGIQQNFGGTNPLNFINPQDIASVTVLKDAGATAIYGSRGANGVILITTKSGVEGRKEINLNYETGLSIPINEFELADGNEWRSFMGQARANSGLDNPNGNFIAELGSPILWDQRLRNSESYSDQTFRDTNTDWVDLMRRDARYKQFSISASNATERTSFFISGQYRNNEGNFGNTNFARYTARINLDFDASDYLKLGTRYTVSYRDERPRDSFGGERSNATNAADNAQNNLGVRPLFGTLYSNALPVIPQFNSDGSVFDPFGNSAMVFQDQDSVNSRELDIIDNIGSLFAEISPLPGLEIRGEAALTYSTRNDHVFTAARPEEITAEDQALIEAGGFQPVDFDYIWEAGLPRIRNQRSQSWRTQLSATASYTRSLEDHNFSFLVGVEKLNSSSEFFRYDVEGGVSPQDPSVVEQITEPVSGEQYVEFNASNNAEVRLFSTLSRLTYNYQNKYYMQASIRRDGSSNLSDENAFAIFPAVSAGWVISDENFLDIPFIDFLKLRAGYGTNGNQAIGADRTRNGYLSYAHYPFAGNTGLVLNRVQSSNIEWERSTTIDIGLDFELLKNKITGSIGYYNTTSDNLLLSIPVAPSIGVYNYGTAVANIGEVRNQGLEIELRSNNLEIGDFRWESNFNITTNNNKILSLFPGFDGGEAGQFTDFDDNGRPRTSVQLNQPLGVFFLPNFAGYDSDGVMLIREVDQGILATKGEYVFTGGTVRNVGNEAQRHATIQDGKSGLPTFFGGLGNTFSYKGLSLYVLFTFQGGNYLYDNIGRFSSGIGNTVIRKDAIGNTWTPKNKDSRYPVTYWNNQIPTLDPEDDPKNTEVIGTASNLYLEKGDFVRLRTINLSYDFPQSLLEPSGFIKGVRVYMNLQNVATFSSFDTVDPEFLAQGNSTRRNLGQGVINGPQLWQVFSASGGVNFRF